MKKSITIDEDKLQRLGSASLIGMVAEDGLKELEIIFPQTSIDWRARNGGPEEWIVNEYNVPCLIEDVVWFMENGVKVKIGYTEDDRPSQQR